MATFARVGGIWGQDTTPNHLPAATRPPPTMTHLLLALAALAPSGDAGDDIILFKAPVQLMAGDAELGRRKMYPSPASFDVDGDGIKDLVLGGLSGRVTWSRRTADGLGPEKPMERTDGKQLDFNNW